MIFAILVGVLSVLAQVAAVSASDSIWPPSHYIGTLQDYLNQVQRLPGVINEAICVHDDAVYIENMSLLAKRIENVNLLLEQMDLKNPMDLKIVHTTILKNKECGIGRIATGYADLAREKLDVEIRDAGLY